ncbi:MAG: M15 family metallopeptidase, partial [Actinomycetota bacterium]|nr:M15 family metallopeptidase [Actinomycetota bacterium]
VPGTSNHGGGIAIDLFCGVEDDSSAQHDWLDEHGDEFAWLNPDWARSGGSRPEPWHWEFDRSLLNYRQPLQSSSGS